MKKSISRFLAMMGMAQAFGVNPLEGIPAEAAPEATEGTKRKRSKPRFVAGDHFYKRISMKRINGKWRCKS